MLTAMFVMFVLFILVLVLVSPSTFIAALHRVVDFADWVYFTPKKEAKVFHLECLIYKLWTQLEEDAFCWEKKNCEEVYRSGQLLAHRLPKELRDSRHFMHNGVFFLDMNFDHLRDIEDDYEFTWEERQFLYCLGRLHLRHPARKVLEEQNKRAWEKTYKYKELQKGN